jgi:excisionase family DNA binding protein
MARTKKKPDPVPQPVAVPAAQNGPGTETEVLTLAEAAAYLRLPEAEVLRMVREQHLPARQVGTEWRFLKPAIRAWLSQPAPRYSKEAQLAVIGSWKDDPDLEAMLEEIYRRRGRPITEDGSYKLFHGLKPGSERE